jgi:hypothetical protein
VSESCIHLARVSACTYLCLRNYTFVAAEYVGTLPYVHVSRRAQMMRITERRTWSDMGPSLPDRGLEH